MIDILFLISIGFIWLLLFFNIVLTYFGAIFSEEISKKKLNIKTDMKRFPFVSIMIPAHNEGIVIEKTLKSMVELDYPNDKYEIIVINDNSSDDTGDIIDQFVRKYNIKNIVHIEVVGDKGGKGKSNALNIGFVEAKGEFVAVYDADNTPNRFALRYLVNELDNNSYLGAVIGKFRTRNKNKNLLTKFINIETLSFQWMAQAGRWKLFKLCTIPGTNFIVRRDILEEIGGWDIKAIAEDTEISFRIYQMGFKIAFMPLAITYEEEPESISVWFKQRTRWVNGNIYVLVKHLRELFDKKSRSVLFDLIYFFSVYILFFLSIIISDVIFILGIFTDIEITITGNFILIWILSYMVFILQVGIALSIEKGEITFENILLVFISYFTYSQLWLLVSIKGMFIYIKNSIMKIEAKWYKTERFG